MPFYTPLRYPGGKRRLAPFVMRLLEANGMRDIEYVEPYAGGASLALALLFEEYASTIHINDLSRPVYAFWYSVLNDTDALCKRIERTEITMDEWHRQRAIYESREDADLAELGFATFFLNRTNRSGILDGGVIGGKGQTGKWPIDARFSKKDLIQRIRRIGRYRNRVRLYQRDALDFINDVLTSMQGRVFTFFDPPYIDRGQDLYLDTYDLDDHRELAARVVRLEQPWVVTYDYDAAIRLDLYPQQPRLAFALSYSAQERRGGKEAMFLSKNLSLPAAWRVQNDITISAKGARHPLYGRIEIMPEHPEMEEGPKAGERFLKALKVVVSIPKENVPNPFKKPKPESKQEKPHKP